MISTLDILLHPKNSMSFKDVKVVDYLSATPQKCAELIKSGTYDASCDINADGFVDVTDYNLLYDMWYGKFDAWMAGELGVSKKFDIRALVRIKKYAAGVLDGYDPDYDLDNDGHITDYDAKIARRWLFMSFDENPSKPPRETFE